MKKTKLDFIYRAQSTKKGDVRTRRCNFCRQKKNPKEWDEGWPTTSFLVTPRGKYKRIFLVVMMKPLRALNKNLNGLITWFIVQSEMLYPQIVSFYQGDLEKEKLKSLLKVSGVMINNRATKFIMPMAFFPMGRPECPHKKEKKLLCPWHFRWWAGLSVHTRKKN